MSSESLDHLLRRPSGSLSELEADRQRKSSKRAQERSLDLPQIQDRRRRREMEAAGTQEWLRYYRGDLFYRPFTFSQSSMVDEIDSRIELGGQKAIAAPRGEGKTAIVEGATLKAVMQGRLKYPLILAANAEAASDILNNIKRPVETNERLLADYPELCIPVRDLSEAPQKSMKQSINGRRTRGAWSKTTVKFPEVWLTWCPWCLSADTLGDYSGPFLCLECGATFDLWKAPFSGARIKAVGIFGKIRGKRDEVQRPDFALADDIEDEEAAVSTKKKIKIRRVLSQALSAVGGPDKKLSTVFLATIQNGTCVSAEYTDRTQQPAYSGDRYAQVTAWPKAEEAKKLWAHYVEMRQDGKRLGNDTEGKRANELYAANREVMDAGFTVSNPYRFVPDAGEISPQQHIYNVAADYGWATVWSEYQNDPQAFEIDSGIPKAEDIERRKNNLPRWTVPAETQKVVAMIDVGQEVLWWKAMALWGPFAGAVLAYGAWPEQHRTYFHADEISPTIQEAYKKAHGVEADLDATIYWALEQLVAHLTSVTLRTESGVSHHLARIGVDSGWETETVYRFCRQHRTRGLVLPTKGLPISIKHRPMSSWERQDGEVTGWNSRVVVPKGRQHHLVEFDANQWKAKYHNRLGLPMGSAAAITLNGRVDDHRTDHKMLAQHLTAEARDLVKVGSREGWEYKQKPGSPDNHWLDCGVGCLVLGGFEGIVEGVPNVKKKDRDQKKRRERVSYF